MKRKSISKRIRFEVFKRDLFTCQYCGRKAPDVVLEIDHIEPVSKSGTNDILNLTTSCKECNSGKSDKQLSDTAKIDKQREVLEELQEKRDQVQMMLDWKKGLLNVNNEEVEAVAEYFTELTGAAVTEVGKKILIPLIRKFGLNECMEAVEISYDAYFRTGKHEETEKMLNKLGGILYNRKLEKDDPEKYEQNRVRGYARIIFGYICEWKCKEIILNLREKTELDFPDIREIIKASKNWTQFYNNALEILEDY